jgi:hypothetical protein
MQRRVSPSSVTTFIAQFPESLQDAALKWLEHIEVVRPEIELTRLIPASLGTHLPVSCRTIGVSPVGAMTDSASRLSYSMRDSLNAPAKDIRLIQVPLSEALGAGLDAYVLFDDNTNSGHQALNIVAAWLDVQLPEEFRLNEEHVQPLPAALRDEFHKKPVLFAFAVETENACNKLRDFLVAECGFNRDLLKCVAGRTLLDKHKCFSGLESAFQHEDIVRLRAFVVDVAKQIFILEGKAEQVAEKRALGDGGAEGMVVFPYNCPTMTVPALWLSGIYRGEQWIPLVERGRRTGAVDGIFVGEDA